MHNCSTVEPASKLTVEKLPWSEQEAKEKTDAGRQYNMKEGLDYRYNLFGSTRKPERLNSLEYTSAPRLANLFSKLHVAQPGEQESEEDVDS